MNEEEGEEEQDEIENDGSDKGQMQQTLQRKKSIIELKKQLSLHSARGGMFVIGEDGAVADQDDDEPSFDGMKTRQHNKKRKKMSQDKSDVLARTRQGTNNAINKQKSAEE